MSWILIRSVALLRVTDTWHLNDSKIRNASAEKEIEQVRSDEKYSFSFSTKSGKIEFFETIEVILYHFRSTRALTRRDKHLFVPIAIAQTLRVARGKREYLIGNTSIAFSRCGTRRIKCFEQFEIVDKGERNLCVFKVLRILVSQLYISRQG